jgi:hypothetical protein
MINEDAVERARQGATTSSAPSHTKIPSRRLSGARRCTRLGSSVLANPHT